MTKCASKSPSRPSIPRFKSSLLGGCPNFAINSVADKISSSLLHRTMSLSRHPQRLPGRWTKIWSIVILEIPSPPTHCFLLTVLTGSYEAGILEDPDRTPVSAFNYFLISRPSLAMYSKAMAYPMAFANRHSAQGALEDDRRSSRRS
jgi:hypothetical protein